jgi:2-C-methyl-D-erythritol 4-phosphate cytidylyltransferase
MPAAGIGARMQSSSLPKQYLPLANKTIIEHSLSRLLGVVEIVALSLHPADQHWAELPLASHEKILTVSGGKERCDSVLNGLLALEHLAQEQDWVLVHDAARPCVTNESIQQLIAQIGDHGVGGILGVPVSDTLKYAAGGEAIRTVDRSPLWQAHTPQMFRYGVLNNSLSLALAEGFQVTDEASALEFAGYQPRLIEDRRDNLKVTRPEDLAMAEAILAYQQEQQNTEDSSL